MSPAPMVLLASMALSTILPAWPDAVATVPIPRFKPSIDELTNFAEMPEDVREAVLRGLAVHLEERLLARPDDVEGWLRLAQTRLALDERARAIIAFERALGLAPTSPSVLLAYATALLERPPGGALPVVTAEAVALYRRLSLVDPRAPEPHWYQGLHAYQNDDPIRAESHWTDALRLVPPDSPDAALMLERIQQLQTIAPEAGPTVSSS